MLMVVALHSYARSADPAFTPPATIVTGPDLVDEADSILLPYPVSPTIPQRYQDFMAREYAADLDTRAFLSRQPKATLELMLLLNWKHYPLLHTLSIHSVLL